MAQKFLNGIDLNKTQLFNAAIHVLASAPSSPVLGQAYWDSVLLGIRLWDGTSWTNRATDSLLLQGNNSAYHLNRANHTGTQLASTISNFDTQVRTSRLDQMAAPTASVSMNGQRLTSVASPVSGTDGVNKNYVDALVQGLDPKPSAMVSTIAALPANTYNNGTAGVGATLTATANGALTVDGYAVQVGDLILVKNETAQANNGLYTATAAGGAGAPYVLTRHTSMDTGGEFGGALIAVENKGSTTANTLWMCNVAESITVGTTAVTFTQINGATQLTAGNGISISAGVVSAVVQASGGLSLSGSGLALDNAIAVRKYVTTIGDNSTTSIVISHNLNTRDICVQLWETASPYNLINCDWQATTVNTATLIFAVAPSSGQYRAVVHA